MKQKYFKKKKKRNIQSDKKLISTGNIVYRVI